MFPETLQKAANRLNKTVAYLGPQEEYSVDRLLEFAMQGIIRLLIVLPGDFIYVSKNHESYRPSREHTDQSRPLPRFPKGFDHLYISQFTAYKLGLHDGKSVDLTTVVNFRPDGEIDEFHAEPGAAHLQVSIADLRIERYELDKLIHKMKASAASLTSEQAPAPSADPAKDGHTPNAQSPASREHGSAQSSAEQPATECAKEAVASESADGAAATEIQHGDACLNNEHNAAADEEYPDDSKGGLKPSERQIRRIEWMARKLGIEPLEVKDGDQARLRDECLTRWPNIFVSKNSFRNAWKSDRTRLRMANHEKFNRKGG